MKKRLIFAAAIAVFGYMMFHVGRRSVPEPAIHCVVSDYQYGSNDTATIQFNKDSK